MLAHASSAQPARSVEIIVDDAQRRISVPISGAAAGPQVWQKVCDTFLGDPARTGYDMLYDIRDYSGDVEAKDVMPIVEIYAGQRVPEADGTRTAFLTHDKNFTLWAEAMNFQFPGRQHVCFEQEADAELFLSTPRARR